MIGFGSGGSQIAVTIADPTPGATELVTITETDSLGATGDVNGSLTGAALTEAAASSASMYWPSPTRRR